MVKNLIISILLIAHLSMPVIPIREQSNVELSPVEMIRAEAEKQKIEPTLAIAISRLETGHFTSAAYVHGNNFGGLSVNECPLYYSTKKDGVEQFISNLRKNYIELDLDTPEEISKKYCPTNHGIWADVVEQLMEEER